MRSFWLLVVVLGQALAEQDQQFFIDYLFDKYGSKGVLTFEGFEHLLESLGLGRLSFDKEHPVSYHKTPDGGFREVHDSLKLHSHQHNRTKRSLTGVEGVVGEGEDPCLSPQDILAAYGLEPNHEVTISPLRFTRMCPAIVYELDQKVCAVPPPTQPGRHPTPKLSAVWGYAVVSIIVISLTGLVAVSLVPLFEKAVFHHVLSFLVAVAVGTLCGDALLHLLPHALASDSPDHTETLLRSSTCFATIMFFFLLEACIHGGHSHGENELSDEYTSVPVEPPDKKKSGEMAVSRLVIIGDALHNLTDGLAVGAAFRADLTSGLATALAVLTHELPHELGDFAVLVKTGMTVKRALFWNAVSSVVSFLGMVGGVFLGDFAGAAHWIYSVTAGSFLYIALADLVPELHKYRKESRWALGSAALQLLGALTGGAVMCLIAVFEETLYTLFDS